MAKKSNKKVFVNDGKGMQEVKSPVETPTATPVNTATVALAPATKPTQEKVDALSKESMDYRHHVWDGLMTGKVKKIVCAATSFAAIWAKFSEKEMPLSLAVFKPFIDDVVAQAKAGTLGKSVPQFSQEAFMVVIKGLMSAANRGIKSAAETLDYLRGGAFNGQTDVSLVAVLEALYARNQANDSKNGKLELDADGKPVLLVCGCGACGGHKFLEESWDGKDKRVGNLIPGEALSTPEHPVMEKFVPVSRRCLGRINKAVYEANEPVAAENAKIAERRKSGERTEPFKAMKPMIKGLTSREVGRIEAGRRHSQERRERSENRIAEIVAGLKAPTRTGVGQGGASAYPETRRGFKRGQESRF